MFKLPRAVWLLGWVSLATDSATEAIYPLLPFFLTRTLGAGAVSLGIVEGGGGSGEQHPENSVRPRWPIAPRGSGRSCSSATACRRWRGRSSRSPRRWTQVFTVRVLDRVGKGVRGAPRDAMLAAWATPTTRGKVYGFHRAMDHAGAVLGPTLATLFLFFYPDRYRTLFALTIIPGAIAVALIFFVPRASAAERPIAAPGSHRPSVASGFSRDVRRSPRSFTVFMIVLVASSRSATPPTRFCCCASPTSPAASKYIPLMWAALHVVKATVSSSAAAGRIASAAGP